MAEPHQPAPDGLKEELGRLGADLRQMAALRWQLARLELDAAMGQAQRLAVVLALGWTAITIAAALLGVALAQWLESAPGGPRVNWLLILGGGLFLGGALAAWLAWRRFRRRFTGLKETLEELREDAIWLEEWLKEEGRREKEEGRGDRQRSDT